MSLAKFVHKLNLENDEALLETPVYDAPDIVEQLEVEEAEAELVEVLDEVSDAEEALDESDEVEAEVDHHIEVAEASIAEAEGTVEEGTEGEVTEEAAADAEASEEDAEGEVSEEDAEEVETVNEDDGSISPEAVAVAQEALKNLYKRTGYEMPVQVTLSRESLRNNTLEAYKMNLEGFKELKDTVVAGAKKIWEKIQAAFRWIMEQFKKVLPSREAKLKQLATALKSAKMKDAAEATKAFTEKYKGKFEGVYNVYSTPQDVVTANKGLQVILDSLKADSLESVTKAIEKHVSIVTSLGSAQLKSKASNAKAGTVVLMIPKGDTVRLLTGPDIKSAEVLDGFTYEGLKLDANVANGYITNFLKFLPRIKEYSAAYVNITEKAVKDQQGFLASKVARVMASSAVKQLTSFQNELYNFIVAYSKAILVASK